MIPRVPSSDVIERTRGRLPTAVIIVRSGYRDEEFLRRGSRTGELTRMREPETSFELFSTSRAEIDLDR